MDIGITRVLVQETVAWNALFFVYATIKSASSRAFETYHIWLVILKHACASVWWGRGLELGLSFIFHLFSFVCLRAVKTPTSLRICAGSSEPSLLVSAKSVKILWTGLNDYNGRVFLHHGWWGHKPPPCSWKERPHDYICHRLWNTQLWCKFFFYPPPPSRIG